MQADLLNNFLPNISSRNAQGEFYFTDIVSLAVEAGHRVDGIVADERIGIRREHARRIGDGNGTGLREKNRTTDGKRRDRDGSENGLR